MARAMIIVVVLAGAIGCGAPEATAPSLTMLAPTSGYLGRQISVEIGGNNTHFVDGHTTVDFGDPNIQVNQVQVAGPSLLQAQITIGPADAAAMDAFARVGPHDVTVTTSQTSEVATVSDIFNVAVPLRFTTLTPDGAPGGTLVQGGIGNFSVENLDYAQDPFDATAPSFSMSFLGNGLGDVVSGAAAQVTGLALIDVKATATPSFMVQGPTPLGSQINYLLPAGQTTAPTIAPRTPLPLALGTATPGSLPDVNDDALYHIAALPAGDRVVAISVNYSSVTGIIIPEAVLLPESGKWADRFSLGGGSDDLIHVMTGMATVPFFSVVAGGNTQTYLAVFDQFFGGGAGYEFSVTVNSAPVLIHKSLTLGTAPATPNQQIDLSQGANYFGQPVLASLDQMHYYQFTVPAGGGKAMYVVTAPQPPNYSTSNAVDVLDGTCQSGTSLFGSPITAVAYNSVTFTAVAGHTYCVVIGDAGQALATGGDPYTLLITPAL